MNEAIRQELAERDRRSRGNIDAVRAQAPVCDSAQAQVNRVVPVRNDTSAQAQDTPVAAPKPMYTVQYAAENARIEQDLQHEELGLSKPTRKQKIMASIVNAQARGDMQAARHIQYLLDSINARECLKRRARITRKHQVENTRSYLNKRDPSSDAE